MSSLMRIALLTLFAFLLTGANVANLQNDQERSQLVVGGLYDGMPLTVAEISRASIQFQDFTELTEENEFNCTILDSGTCDVVQDVENGVYRFNATTANDGAQGVQHADADGPKEGVGAPAAGTIVVFEARVKVSDWDDADWFIGLAESDGSITGATGDGALTANGGDNHVGWHHLIADSGIPGLSTAGNALANAADVTQTAGTVGASGNLLVDATYYRFGIRIEGTSTVQFFIDDSAVSAKATLGTALDDGLQVTFMFIANGSSVDMDVDYTLLARTR